MLFINQAVQTLISSQRFFCLLGAYLFAFSISYSAADEDVSLQQEAGILLQSYRAAQFSQYNPRTAFDLVSRVPGFSIDEESAQRGFGQASSNVLVNGARISGKSNGVVKTLKRIPLSSVVRADVYEGSSLGIAGLSGVVVDVIIESKGVAGAWSWQIQHRDQNDNVDPAYWKSSFSVSGEVGITAWTVGFDNDYQRLGHGGPELVFNNMGDLTETRDEFGAFDRDRPSLTVGFEFRPHNGHLAHLNLFYERYWQHDVELRDSSGDDRRFERTDNESNAEISGDYEFDVGTGRLKLIALQSLKHSPDKQQILENQSTLRFTSDRRDEFGETILRSEYRVQAIRQMELQFSAEVAYNFLDSRVVDRLQNSVREEKVEEQRAQISASLSVPLGKRIQLQGSIGTEYSEIEQSGDQSRQRDFFRTKGFISAAYQINGGNNLSLRLERKIGQLSFADFIAADDLLMNSNSVSNTELVPDQTWRVEASLDQKWQFGTTSSLTLFNEDVDDLVGSIVVNGQNAVGNISSAKRYGIEWELFSDLDFIGFTGGQLEFNAKLQKSSLKDPVTGETRRISEDRIHFIETELRQDIPRTDWAWGVNYEVEQVAAIALVNQSTFTNPNHGLLVPFVEHKDFFGLTVKFSARNYTDRVDNQVNRNFDLNPAGGRTLNEVEVRDRDFGRIYILDFSGTF